MLHQAFTVKTVPTKPIDGQKTGTSGLRKKTKVFTGENYLANWYEAVCKRGPGCRSICHFAQAI